MKQNILINKIIFSPNLKPGQVMQIETEDEKATGLLYENKDDYITVIVIKENYDEYGTITYAVENMKINAREVEDNSVLVQQINPELKLAKLYNMFKEVSTLLSDEETMNAEANGSGNREDIETRHKARLSDFLKIIKE